MPTLQLAAFRSHHTATSDRSWDGPANETRVKTGQPTSYYSQIYAWQDPSGTDGTKAAYRFIHHEVGSDGDPGPANVKACITGIAVLNGGRGGTTIPDSDRQGLFTHLATHLRDADVHVPPLKAAADADEFTGIVFRVQYQGKEWTVDTDGVWQLALPSSAASADAEAAQAVEQAAAAVEQAAAGQDLTPAHLVPWSGVLCVEGTPTGDGRQFNVGSLFWDEGLMPQDLFAMLRDPEGGEGHDGAEVCGRIDRIWRQPHPSDSDLNLIMGEGVYDTKLPTGETVARLQQQGMLTGVSIDVDSVQVSVAAEGLGIEDMLGGGVTKFDRGRIRRATICSIPAFIEARIRPVDTALLASGDTGDLFPTVWTVDTPATGWGTEESTLVASAFGDRSEPFTSPIVELPPNAVFSKRTYDAYTPVSIDADGVIGGHVVPWGECHIGFRDRCVMVQGSDNAYRYARTGHVLTREGDLVPTARIFAQFRAGRRGHADERLAAADAVAWYEEMSQCVADVVIYDDQHGMQIQGRVRPGITQHQLIALRGSDLSPDWRAIKGKRECLAIAAVNVSGFPSRYDRIPALVASGAIEADVVELFGQQIVGTGWIDDGQLLTLVASAAAHRPEHAGIQALSERITSLESQLAVLTAAHLAAEAQKVLDGLEFTEADDPEAQLRAAAEAALAGLDVEDLAKKKRKACSCGTDVDLDDDGHGVCPECGTEFASEDLAMMDCPECGKPVVEGAKSCPHCGADMMADDGEENTTVTVVAAATCNGSCGCSGCSVS